MDEETLWHVFISLCLSCVVSYKTDIRPPHPRWLLKIKKKMLKMGMTSYAYILLFVWFFLYML